MIGERFNFEDVFFRDLTICVLDTLEGEIKWTNRFSSGDRIVNVPFYYSMTGDERFLLDSFHDDVVSDNRYVDLNTDIIPRGHLTLTGYDIRSEEFANPNVWLKMVVENEDEIRNILTKVRAIPITVKYDLSIHLSSEIDTFKCSQSIMDTLWLYRYMYFEHNFMNIDAVMTIPDTNSIEIVREKSFTSDNTIKLTVQFDVQTYYPSYRKPKFPQPVSLQFNCGYPNKNICYQIIIVDRIGEIVVKESHNYTSGGDSFVNITIGNGQLLQGNYGILLKNTQYFYSINIDFNCNQTFTKIPFITILNVDTNYLDSDSIVKISIYDEFSTNLIYSESQEIKTSTTGKFEYLIGKGDVLSGNFFQLTSDYQKLKYKLEIDVNKNNNFVTITSFENLDLNYSEEIYIPETEITRDGILSNSYTQLSSNFDNTDIILYPKMTRWYKNLISLTEKRPSQMDVDSNVNRPRIGVNYSRNKRF